MISCKICGDPLSREVACCATCLTPHHGDCWDFNGMCAVYGCGSTRADRFDFRQKTPDELLLALSTHVARALSAERALVPTGDRSAATAPAAPTGDDLFRYKRGLFRSLQATLDKVRPPGSLEEETRQLFDEAAGTGEDRDEVFVSEEVDLGRRTGGRDVQEKRALMRRLAADDTIVPREEPLHVRFLSLLRALWRALFPSRRDGDPGM